MTPLQMARFYALIANGGRLVTPHLGSQRRAAPAASGLAGVLRRFAPPRRSGRRRPGRARRRPRGPLPRDARPDGTSTGVFGSVPVDIAGKTGTAEKCRRAGTAAALLDQSWWCGYGPYDDPRSSSAR